MLRRPEIYFTSGALTVSEIPLCCSKWNSVAFICGGCKCVGFDEVISIRRTKTRFAKAALRSDWAELSGIFLEVTLRF